MSHANTTIIIPTLNEAQNITELLDTIKRNYAEARVIVADDGSTDGTKEKVTAIGRKNKNIKLLDRSSEKLHGLTASVIDAVKISDSAFVAVIDGDLQHPPEKIKEIAKKLEEGNDIAIGTREKVEGNWPLQRRIMSKTATILAQLKLRRMIKDPMSGFFGARTSLFRKVLAENEVEFEKKGYKVLFELLKYAPDAKIAEVRYIFRERSGGKSKIGKKQVIAMARSLIK